MRINYLKILIYLCLCPPVLNYAAPGSPSDFVYVYRTGERLALLMGPEKDLGQRFNGKIKAEKIRFAKTNTLYLNGFSTRNRSFLEQVMVPVIVPLLDTLKKMQPAEVINELTLFGHEAFRTYIGKSFYRWGGDILDLDDPQDKGTRIQFTFGLDCSGFVSMPYEMATYFFIMDAKKDNLVFSSKGFEQFCKGRYFRDTGGRNGTPNNYRIDTGDLVHLGRQVLSIPKGGKPSNQQLAKLQPGDIVGRNGHFGIIVQIKGTLYYLESGGWVSPKSNGYPYRADKALEIFAKSGELMVRRCLPDLVKKELAAN